MMLEIAITDGPEDVTVNEGGTASFPCWVTGTTDLPFWYINDFIYTIQFFPPRHYYSNNTLLVLDVQLSDNGTTYQCSLHVASSRIGVLTVATISGKNC